MGKWEDWSFTIRPADDPVADVAATVVDLLERPPSAFPAARGPGDADGHASLERGALGVAADDDQVYLGGRTHSPGVARAWRDGVVAAGVGDGDLAVVVRHEEAPRRWGWLLTWDRTRGAYVHHGTGDPAPFEGSREQYGDEVGEGPEREFVTRAAVRPAWYDGIQRVFVLPDGGRVTDVAFPVADRDGDPVFDPDALE